MYLKYKEMNDLASIQFPQLLRCDPKKNSILEKNKADYWQM